MSATVTITTFNIEEETVKKWVKSVVITFEIFAQAPEAFNNFYLASLCTVPS